jgi:hypothetical protein
VLEQANPEADLRCSSGLHVVDTVADEERRAGTSRCERLRAPKTRM